MVKVLLASPTVIAVAAGVEGKVLLAEVPASVAEVEAEDTEVLLEALTLEADFVLVPLVLVRLEEAELDSEAGAEGPPAEVETDVQMVIVWVNTVELHVCEKQFLLYQKSPVLPVEKV
jgi:hypothetical protein